MRDKWPGWTRVAINILPIIVTELNVRLKGLKVSPDDLHDLFNDSLLGVCPECNEYCAGKAFLDLPLFAAAAGGVRFTGDSGGFERMLQGTCLNYSCASTEFDLFWCPDLDGRMVQNLRARGINIDPSMQKKRDRVWRPGIGPHGPTISLQTAVAELDAQLKVATDEAKIKTLLAAKVRALIAEGAHQEAMGKALIEAAKFGLTESVGALIAAGVDVNQKDWSGETALWKAAGGWGADASTARALIAAGARVDERNNKGECLSNELLRAAAEWCDAGLVHAMIAAGADVNAKGGMAGRRYGGRPESTMYQSSRP